MQVTAPLYDQFRQPTGYLGKIAGRLMTPRNGQLINWTVEQLNIKPYQQILEIGYGPGHTLQEVGRKLQIGFLAGTDPSVGRYQQAYQRNKRLVRQQLLQLHIGTVHELPYPSHYFHSIYGINAHIIWKEPKYEFMKLASLLKTDGKLVMVFQPRWATNEEEVHLAAQKITEEYLEAGLVNVQIEFNDIYPASCISATAFKP
jgi:ubiquinone/menaquinone biosynthesis C-methylase UbiE